MEHLRRRKETAKPQESSRQQDSDDFQPTIEWHESPSSHILVIDLPGFKKDDLKVQVDGSGKLTIKGTRKVMVSKHHRLDKTFQVPEDANIDQISGKLDDGRLTLVVPRKGVEESGLMSPSRQYGDAKTSRRAKEEEDGDGGKVGSLCEKEGCRLGEDWVGEDVLEDDGLVERLLEKVNSNRKVIAMAVVAFTIGFYVSRILIRSS